MIGKLEVVLNDEGGLEFNVDMPDVYTLKVIASLEEYLAGKLSISVDEIREIIDDEKPNLKARKK